MGVPAFIWFLIAAVAAIAGGALLFIDHEQHTAHNRERRRWAALRGWQFAATDPALPDRWRHGALAHGSAGTARNVVTGSLFTAAGRRLVHVFDFEQAGRVESVLVAVHRRISQPVVLELWLPTVQFPTDAGLDLLGPVGDRYAFTSDAVQARPFITPDLVTLADDIGADVPVAWIEDAWVAASVSVGAQPPRVEQLLRLLGELADLVDGVHRDQPMEEPANPEGPVEPVVPVNDRAREPESAEAETQDDADGKPADQTGTAQSER